MRDSLTRPNIGKQKGKHEMAIMIEADTTEIPAQGYENREDVEYLYIPKSVRKIGRAAFRGCHKLTEIEFEEGPQSLEIGAEAFAECRVLTSLRLPARINRFLNRCFANSGLQSIEIGGGGDFIAMEFRLFEGCPNRERLLATLENERIRRAQPLMGGAVRQQTYPCNALLSDLKFGIGCGPERIRTGLRELFRRMRNDNLFTIETYARNYQRVCQTFRGIRDWATIDGGTLHDLVAGTSAKQVAALARGEILNQAWQGVDRQQVCRICHEIKTEESMNSARVEQWHQEFIGLFPINFHAAFYRLIAIAKPDQVVQIPAGAKLAPLYEWFTGLEVPTISQSDWWTLSRSVRQALTDMLPDVDVYRAGAFAWYLAEAFRLDVRDEGIIRKKQVLAWMRGLQMIG